MELLCALCKNMVDKNFIWECLDCQRFICNNHYASRCVGGLGCKRTHCESCTPSHGDHCTRAIGFLGKSIRTDDEKYEKILERIEKRKTERATMKIVGKIEKRITRKHKGSFGIEKLN